jgi:hypothetical protein
MSRGLNSERVVGIVPGLSFAAVTAPFFSLAVVTAFFFSCFVPTEFLGSLIAAYDAPLCATVV